MRLSEYINLLRTEFDLSGLREMSVSVGVNCDGTVDVTQPEKPDDPPAPRRLIGMHSQIRFEFQRPFVVSDAAAQQSPPATL